MSSSIVDLETEKLVTEVVDLSRTNLPPGTVIAKLVPVATDEHTLPPPLFRKQKKRVPVNVNSFATLQVAFSFAARAHRHQVRKDGLTPYVAHPMRVCMVIRHLFGIDDVTVLCAAVLHDTIEDTTTDYDDLAEHFGTDVADAVAGMSKDMRMPEAAREAEYLKQLLESGWRVMILKLADMYDNLSDFSALTPKNQRKQLRKAAEYLDHLRPNVPPEVTSAFAIVEAFVAELDRQLSIK